MGYFLMIKRADEINMKYLCKCIDNKNHLSYKGSGVRWRRLIKKYNCTITTEVLGWYETKEELKQAGLYYSELWNVVASPEWANYIPEIGDGGSTVKGKIRAYNTNNPKEEKFFNSIEELPEGWKRGRIGTKKTPEQIEKQRNLHLGKKRGEEARRNMREAPRPEKRRKECSICHRNITLQNFNKHKCNIGE